MLMDYTRNKLFLITYTPGQEYFSLPQSQTLHTVSDILILSHTFAKKLINKSSFSNFVMGRVFNLLTCHVVMLLKQINKKKYNEYSCIKI